MERLRQQELFLQNYTLPLSHEESARGNWENFNPTWLAEHRPKPWTHPEAKDLTFDQVNPYHLYSIPEDCIFQSLHWTTQTMDISWDGKFWGYNPTFTILGHAQPRHVCMFLPIYQRYLPCKVPNIIGEIFDNLRPRYNKI